MPHPICDWKDQSKYYYYTLVGPNKPPKKPNICMEWMMGLDDKCLRHPFHPKSYYLLDDGFG